MVAGIVTALLLAVFVGGWAWAWSPRRREAFDRAAHTPLREDNSDAREEEAP